MFLLFFPRMIAIAGMGGLAIMLMAAAPSNTAPASSATNTQYMKPENTVSAPATSVTKTAERSAPVAVKTRSTGTLASGPTASPASKPTSSVISKPAATHEPLSMHDEELAKAVKFDQAALCIIRETTHERLQRLVGYDENGYRINAPGIAVSVPEEKSSELLAVLRAKLRPLDYLAFVVEMNGLLKTDKIGVIRGRDQYEIIRIMHTDGEEDSIATDEIIDRLKEWEKISSFIITGADNDWIELEFSRLPADLKSFGEDIYDFSPDAVDEGPGSVEGIVRDLQKTKHLFLSW